MMVNMPTVANAMVAYLFASCNSMTCFDWLVLNLYMPIFESHAFTYIEAWHVANEIWHLTSHWLLTRVCAT